MAEIVINNSYYNNKLNNLIDEFYSLDTITWIIIELEAI